jgi:purine-nucleoside phosphorylase
MLVVAAVQEELGDLGGVVVGVGPIPAAVNAAAVLARQPPRGVVLIGTCGSYIGGPPIGSVVVAQRTGWSAGVAAMGLGYVPRPPQPVLSDAAILESIPAHIPRVSVLTTAAVTTDPTLANRLADGWACEHLEAYGVAAACAALNVPFVAILGVTNVVGPDAHLEWLTHRNHAQDAARAVARDLLAAI